MIPMADMHLGEIVFGGVGSGLCGMRSSRILAVFLAGLMVGRTPEYIGKKVQSFEIQHGGRRHPHLPGDDTADDRCRLCTGLGDGDARITPGRTASARCFMRMTSATGNNGSAFAGISVEHRVLQQLAGIRR